MDRYVGSTFERGRLSHGCADGFCWDIHREAGGFLKEERFSGWGMAPFTFFELKGGCLPAPTGRQTFCLHQSTCFRQQLGDSHWTKHKMRRRMWRALGGGAAPGAACRETRAQPPVSALPLPVDQPELAWEEDAFSFGRLEACKPMKSWTSPGSASHVH